MLLPTGWSRWKPRWALCVLPPSTFNQPWSSMCYFLIAALTNSRSLVAYTIQIYHLNSLKSHELAWISLGWNQGVSRIMALLETAVHVHMLSCFSHAQLFAILWTVAHRALCPWDFPGKNTGNYTPEILKIHSWIFQEWVGALPGPGMEPTSSKEY